MENKNKAFDWRVATRMNSASTSPDPPRMTISAKPECKAEALHHRVVDKLLAIEF